MTASPLFHSSRSIGDSPPPTGSDSPIQSLPFADSLEVRMNGSRWLAESCRFTDSNLSLVSDPLNFSEDYDFSDQFQASDRDQTINFLTIALFQSNRGLPSNLERRTVPFGSSAAFTASPGRPASSVRRIGDLTTPGTPATAATFQPSTLFEPWPAVLPNTPDAANGGLGLPALIAIISGAVIAAIAAAIVLFRRFRDRYTTVWETEMVSENESGPSVCQLPGTALNSFVSPLFTFGRGDALFLE
jgi:hypothetical protein